MQTMREIRREESRRDRERRVQDAVHAVLREVGFKRQTVKAGAGEADSGHITKVAGQGRTHAGFERVRE